MRNNELLSLKDEMNHEIEMITDQLADLAKYVHKGDLNLALASSIMLDPTISASVKKIKNTVLKMAKISTQPLDS